MFTFEQNIDFIGRKIITLIFVNFILQSKPVKHLLQNSKIFVAVNILGYCSHPSNLLNCSAISNQCCLLKTQHGIAAPALFNAQAEQGEIILNRVGRVKGAQVFSKFNGGLPVGLPAVNQF